MDWSVNNLHVVVTFDSFLRKRQRCQILDELAVYFFPDCFNQRRITFELDVGSRTDFVYFRNRVFVVRSNHLCSIIPVGFVSIVFFWIMGRCQNNTALATQLADSV